MISSVKMEAFLGKRFFPGSFVNQMPRAPVTLIGTSATHWYDPLTRGSRSMPRSVDGLTPRVCYHVDTGTFTVRSMLWQLSWPLACRF